MAEPTSIPFDVPIVPETATVKTTGVVMQCPVRLGSKADNSDFKTLPLEPMVSVRGRNVVAIRGIAKKVGGGTVKEKFATDDYEITIVGTLDSGEKDVYPEEWVSWLKGLCVSGKPILIYSKLTQSLGLLYMTILDWDFPATQGVNWQDFSIRGISDDPFFELIVKT
jgi:Domain of unknown function (DUF6046)